MILFSDGEPSDNNDKTETEASAVKLKEAGYTVITVGLGLNNETATWLGESGVSRLCIYGGYCGGVKQNLSEHPEHDHTVKIPDRSAGDGHY